MRFKHFTYKEFDCKSGKGNGENMDNKFIDMLDKAREKAGIPFIITSGYRTNEYNQYLIDSGYKGSATSSHLKGVASDIEAKTSEQRYKIITALLDVGATRIGIGKNFIHVDTDIRKIQNLIWTYY